MRLKLEWFRVALKEQAWMRYGGQAVFYAVGLLMVTGWWTRWGAWYSSSLPYRLQTEALLRGKLALSENPMDLDHDFAWSQQGVHQVWGLGVPLWRLPFEAVAKLLGFDAFPDRIAFGLFAGLVAFMALRVWTTAGLSNSQQQRPADLVWRFIVGFGIGFLLLLMFPPFLNLLQTRGAVWEEAVAYEYLFGILLLTLLLDFSQKPSVRRLYWLCALTGLGGLIRPPLVFYGLGTMAVALWIWIGDAKPNKEAQEAREKQAKSRRQVGVAALVGVLLFCMGGGLLWGTNRLRFGDGFEFGHKLNMQDMVGSLYATKFDAPFEEEPFASAAAELLGSLFLATDNFNGNRWYEKDIFAGQSSMVRWREFYFRTYDWTYALLVLLGWGVGFVVLGKVVWRRLGKGRSAASLLYWLSFGEIRWLGILGWWSMLAALPLGMFYLRAPVLSSRYMLDLGPAFGAAIAAAWGVLALGCRGFGARLGVALVFCLWMGFELWFMDRSYNRSLMNNTSIARLSMSSGEGQGREYQVSSIGQRLGGAGSGIRYDRTGWDGRTGALKPLAIVFARDVAFVELELESVPHARIEAKIEDIRVKAGLEVLERESVIRTGSRWRVRFRGPQARRWREGVQALFVASVPHRFLAADTTLWKLHSIRWRNNSPEK